MFRTSKTLRKIAVGVGCVAVLALVWIAFGCGKDNTKTTNHLAVRKSGSNRPVSSGTLPLLPDTGTTISSVVAEDATVPVPEPPKAVTYDEAETAYKEGRYREAAALFARYTDLKGENPWGFYMLGLSSWKAGDHESAEKAFERALELDPRHVKSYLNLCRVLLDTHRSQEAMKKIENALEIDPQSNVAYRLKGRALRQTGEMNEAVEAYRRAIQIDDQDVWSMNNLALIYIESGLFEKALPPLARALELESGEPIFFNNLGMALEGTGHFRAAEGAYQSAVAIDPSYFKAGMNLARIEGVAEEPNLEPAALDMLAQRFVDEIGTWRRAAVASESTAEESLPADAHVAGDADSVVVRRAESPGAAKGE